MKQEIKQVQTLKMQEETRKANAIESAKMLQKGQLKKFTPVNQITTRKVRGIIDDCMDDEYYEEILD